MDFEFTDEQRLIRETARNFTDNEIVERARENDRNEHFDLELVGKIAAQGYLGAIVPREYGGAGLDYLSYGLVVEEIGRGCSAMRTVISVQTSLVCSAILKWGTEEQKQHYLPKLTSGEWLGCFGLTEPDTGSDAANQKTRAKKTDDGWVINGSKMFISLGNHAKVALIFAQTDPERRHRGVACFLVDTDQPGFQPQEIHHKMGLRGSDTAAIGLDDVHATDEQMLGEVGDGFKIAMTSLDSGRYSVAAGCVGICQGCVDASVKYSTEREQFGRPIASFQLVQQMIANMKVDTDAARMLVWRAGYLKDAGKPNTTETSIAKYFATEAAVRTANTAIQVHGGSGYVDDYPVERYFRDVRVTTLYEGTSQIQQLIIGRALTGINALVPELMAAPPKTIGVIGAGTMGAGIAQLACLQAGATTLLHDPIPEALERGTNAIRGQLARGATRGRWTEQEAEAADGRLTAVATLTELAEAELVIEAAPESLELKQDLFAQLEDGVVSETAVLATNTSSLLVTAVASKLTNPERVVGMHFFNPPPVMPLLEVVAGAESGGAALATARAAGEAMGKRVIDAIDGPGFLVNRCNRPWGVEALKLLSERIAPLETIDRIMRQAGGFRMGPFELMDLVGVDVGLAVSKSFYEQSFGEPRWQPSPITVKAVAAGRLGRKSQRGYYDYARGTDAYREPDTDPPAPSGGDGVIVIAGDTPLAAELEQAATAAGWTAITPIEAPDADPPFLILDASLGEDLGAPLQGGPQAILTAAGSLATLDAGGSAVGFHALPPLDDAKLIELTRGAQTSDAATAAAEHFFSSLGKHVVYVDDAPGLVLGRIVCQIINECAFALGEGVGTAADIDTGLVYGMNHPRGPLSWADAIGIDHVLAVLDGLYEERREERYRLAPQLRTLALEGRLGRQTGEGFFGYDS